MCVHQTPTYDGYVNEYYPCLDHTYAVYYRDAWITKKFVKAKCAVLHASGVQGFEVENGIVLPWPFDQPFLNLATVNPHQAAVWDGWKHLGCK